MMAQCDWDGCFNVPRVEVNPSQVLRRQRLVSPRLDDRGCGGNESHRRRDNFISGPMPERDE